ncbi:MAG: ComEC/Rec2 family competence protein [Candidatus Kerfeldbacteria bacterium]|nr:ComEC/Rec2 family competence protein [Candidatus Kerfeldbacteria bacterium]
MPRSYLLSTLAGFLGGLMLAELTGLTWWPAGGLLVTGFGFWPWSRLRLVSCVVIGMSFGLGRWAGWVAPSPHNLVSRINQPVAISGLILERPSTESREMTVELSDLRMDGERRSGKTAVDLLPGTMVSVGDRVTMRCQPVPIRSDRRWSQMVHGLTTECLGARIVHQERARLSPRLVLAYVREWARRRIETSFNEPAASFLVGLLLGAQADMPYALRQEFRLTGTTHLVALSGFNVTIIVTAASTVLIRIIGRRWAWLPTVFLVIGFVIMTGASASVTRAGLMVMMVVLASRLGRPIAMARLLGYTLLVMTWNNPLILLHDLGFQLSFLATIGLVGVAKPLAERLPWVPEAFGLRDNLATTLAAMLMTEPLLLWHFGRLSLVAPLVNTSVLPLIPLGMGLGFGALFVGLLGPATDTVVRGILSIIHWGATLPNAAVQLSGWLVALTAALAVWFAFHLMTRNHATESPLA